jgi:inner membrane protein
MPTIFGHSAVPLAMGLGLGRRVVPGRLLLAGLVASIVPDLDVAAFRFDIAYSDQFGHRGFSHSVFLATCLALMAALSARKLQAGRINAFLFVLLAGMSHGMLDMLTNGGLGVALWWPFSEERLFFPWQVIKVSSLNPRGVFSSAGLRVLGSELLWVWLPSFLVCTSLALIRRRTPSGVQMNLPK